LHCGYKDLMPSLFRMPRPMPYRRVNPRSKSTPSSAYQRPVTDTPRGPKTALDWFNTEYPFNGAPLRVDGPAQQRNARYGGESLEAGPPGGWR
jgi:hypothetical protein